MPNQATDSAPSSSLSIRLGTRASKLAMWQSTWVKSELEARGFQVDLIQIKTDGDVKSGPLAQIGGQGLFTKQLQIALLENQIDLAVHSLKDLPTEDHPQLTIAAVPAREDTADALISNRYDSLDQLPQQAVVGTGSVRRAAQLKHLRPDLDIRDIRGNVDTRLKKLDDGDFDAIILAAAGLKRLGFADRIKHAFTPIELMPAVGQGALGLETRSADADTVNAVKRLNHPTSYHRAMAERSMLKALFAGCLAPVGASTMTASNSGEALNADKTMKPDAATDSDHQTNSADGSNLTLTGVVLSTDGQNRVAAIETMPLENSIVLGQSVAKQLVDQGADRFLKNA